jgi:F-type H+-transporting ATPase subunit delta
MAEKITIARPYAQAVFDIARDKGALVEWSRTLELLSLIVSDSRMAQLLGNPHVSSDQLVQLISDVGGDALDKTAGSLLRVLAENRRLGLLPELSMLYEALRADAEKTVQAEVVSAFPLGDEQKAAIAASLKRRLGREVQLTCTTDESLIGGAVIRAGDLVIDGSVTAHVDRLAGALSR